MRFMASVEIDGRRARPRRYARRRLDFQLAAYRLLVFDICFPFVKLIEAPTETPRSGVVHHFFFFFGEWKSPGSPSHIFRNVREGGSSPEKTCAEYVNRNNE